MTVIEFHRVSKRYRRHAERPMTTTLKSYFLRDLRRRSPDGHDVLWALREIDFKVMKGTMLGVIGRNGAGKSTLLKLISRILKPDAGTISVQGQIAALIELGAGFHPELSGRENIIINGVILGLSKSEIKSRLDEIIDFAEL